MFSRNISVRSKSSISQPNLFKQYHILNPPQRNQPTQSLTYDLNSGPTLNENNYNAMIYQWRKTQSAPIVKIIQISSTNRINIQTGESYIDKTIKPQQILCRLTNIDHFSKNDFIMILKNMLDGHQKIFHKIKATSVSIDKIYVNVNQQVIVWINQFLQRNDISGEILTKEKDIVRKIYSTVCFFAQQRGNLFHQFSQYVNSALKRNGEWKFSYLRALIRSYTHCLKIKLSNHLESTEQQHKINIHYSYKQNKSNKFSTSREILQKRLKRQLNPKYLNINKQKYLDLSLNIKNKYLTIPSLSNKYIGQRLSLSKTPTNKSIGQKQNLQFYNSVYSSVRHSRSNNQIKNQQYVRNNIYDHQRINSINNSISIPQQPVIYQQHNYKINQMLVNKIGITTLPEVQDDQVQEQNIFSNIKLSTKQNNLGINKQFDIKLDINNIQKTNKQSKDSSISTTNQTSISGQQYNLSKKQKDSHITITLDQKTNKNNTQFKTTSGQLTPLISSKKTMTSCTNWSNHSNLFFGNNTFKQHFLQTKEEEYQQSSLQSSTKIQMEKQTVSYHNLQNIQEQLKTPIKSDLQNNIKNSFMQLNEYKSQQCIQQQNTQKKTEKQVQNSLQSTQKKQMIVDRIKQLINLKKKLVISTYMQTQQQKNIRQKIQKHDIKQKKFQQFQQTIQQLKRANTKQQQIITDNQWTKKLQTLLGIDQKQLKQSISIGNQQIKIKQFYKFKLLDKKGRFVQQSVMPL